MLAQATPPPVQPSIRCGAPERHATLVRFRTADGVQLDGAIVGSGRRGVVLVHESGRIGMCGWWPYAVRLASSGVRAMVFDLRCYGYAACPVKHVQGTGSDTAAAVAALRRSGARSVAVVGASLGGSAAIVGAAQARGVSAVVSLSGDENAENLSAGTPLTAFKAAPRIHARSLVAVAREDPYVTVGETRRLSAAFGGSSSLVVLPAPNGHGWDLLRTPVRHVWSPFEHRLTRFLGGR